MVLGYLPPNWGSLPCCGWWCWGCQSHRSHPPGPLHRPCAWAGTAHYAAAASTWTVCGRCFALPYTVCPIHASVSLIILLMLPVLLLLLLLLLPEQCPINASPCHTQCVPFTLLHLLLLRLPAISLGFTIFWVRFFCICDLFFKNPTIEVVTFCLHGYSCFHISSTPTDAASTTTTAVTWIMCGRCFALPLTVWPIHVSISLIFLLMLPVLLLLLLLEQCAVDVSPCHTQCIPFRLPYL